MGSEAPLGSWGAGGTTRTLGGLAACAPILGTSVLRALGGPAFYGGQLQEGGGGPGRVFCQSLSPQPRSSDAVRSLQPGLTLGVSASLHWVLSPQRSGPKLSSYPDAH